MNQSLLYVSDKYITEWKDRIVSKMEVIDECRRGLLEADIVLIGFGREFAVKIKDVIKDNPIYKESGLNESALDDLEKTWIELTLMAKTLEYDHNAVVKERLQIYNGLAEYLKSNKKENYFVVTTCNDDIITKSLFDGDRIVKPCGTLGYMKCDTGCFKHVYDTKEVYDNIYSILSEHHKKGFTDRDNMWNQLKEAMPQCPMCKRLMSVNMVGTNNYSEEGYREQWDSYMSWLQRTLNKKLVMIELGEGFDTPTVIRWPFEKVAAINNKATLVRVNDRFWQITEDIEAKAVSVKMSGIDFVKELIGKE